MVIWITGLPGAGKSTIATSLLNQLRQIGRQALLLDGDKLREALQSHAYDVDARKELALTYSRLAKMFSEQDTIAICATVSMFHAVRDWNRENIAAYFEVYVKVSDHILRERNQKNLYSDAENGTVSNVHGFDIALELPKRPDLVIVNDGQDAPEMLVQKIIEGIQL